MADLAVRGLEVRYPGLDQPALSIPELDLKGGVRIALTGPSGSGKTTFLNLLTGLDRIRRGSVAWDDVELSALGEGARDRWRARTVGLVMQEFHLFPGLSALDNVLLPQRLARRRAPADSPADLGETGRALLARVGIARLDQPVETMSRGQMQRVAVARALAGRPDVLIADEPTASLDAESGATVAALLVELAADAGATLIAATHDPRLIARLDGGALRLADGRLVA